MLSALSGRVPEEFPEHCVVATDGDRVVARGLGVPFDGESDDGDGGERRRTCPIVGGTG
ncbi:hypothetical protein [Embleya sp. MST-111070]|uniref:hypothetical protein n=1 Tax=Embleya sp. MST-111070 TaxID=3398231 RepID=UPI003F735074